MTKRTDVVTYAHFCTRNRQYETEREVCYLTMLSIIGLWQMNVFTITLSNFVVPTRSVR